MLMLGPLGFTAPWLLLGLLALPVLWFLLRAVPPAPIRRRFPGVALLLGLSDDRAETDRTPWWLLLLRMLAVAAVIIGFSGPVLNPQAERPGSGPLLIAIDGTWADARDWSRRSDRIAALLSEAGRGGRQVALVSLTDLPQGPLPFQAADTWAARLGSLAPRPYGPQPARLSDWAAGLDGDFETFWLSDGLARGSRAALLSAFEAHGPVTVFESPRPVLALRPARFEGDLVVVTALRVPAGSDQQIEVVALGPDPNGVERVLAREKARFEPGSDKVALRLSLPPELRNRISRFEIAGQRSAGAVALTDDALRRRKVALIAGHENREGLQLLSPTHYLRQALAPTADLIDGGLLDVVKANPDVIIFADVARISDAEAEAVSAWVEAGGMLLRFAGPRLAASDISRAVEDPLMPVRLRAGGRSVGGAMSWGEPKTLRPFDAGGPFAGLTIPGDVSVSAQVMAQPGPELADRVIATLADGTPLVTRKRMGAGQVVLFHVTANAEWSSLPLSGLFVQMLERLAVSTGPARPDAAELAGTVWSPQKVMDGFGVLQDAGALGGVEGEVLARARPSAKVPPGLYTADDRRIALNVAGPETVLKPALWPARIKVEGLSAPRETLLKGVFLSAALIALFADVLASLWLSGRLTGPRAGRAGRAAALVLALALPGAAWLYPAPAVAQTQAQNQTQNQTQAAADAFAIASTSEVVLAHVMTGNGEVDRVAQAGLLGLSQALYQRTSVEPSAPIEVNLETDELSFFPLLYWPVTADQPLPSSKAYAKLNRYLRTGGMIVFDTRDADVADFGAASPNGKKLQQLARGLDIPPLEPVPSDHVLTRTFYLLQDFPGRFASRDVWVEAAPADAEKVEGMPFRNLNDGVTPVVIGGNDWAAAWAVDGNGNRMFRVGRGFAGERQRELALRFGINLVMHVLTGNYKSDQVHVPALLDRLSQ